MDADLLDTLRRLEEALAAADPAGLDRPLPDLIADDFREFGASGRTWDAPAMRETLAGATPVDPVELEAFELAELAPGVALATYRLGPPRPSNRASVWVRRDNRWQVRFHQGTLRPDDA